MKERNIFFDLDGTLLDSRERLYRLFQNLVPASNLSFDEYWSFKKQKINHEQILKAQFGWLPEEIASFQKEWMSRIEEKDYLDLDIPFEGVHEFLSDVKENFTLYIVSHRQFYESAGYQLDKWSLTKYFEKLLITKQQSKKADLILNIVPSVNRNDIFVGDTGEDIKTAQSLGITSIAVLSGFLSKEVLTTYNPDYIFNNITDIKFRDLENGLQPSIIKS
jgi:phosphoglycolate phosphatase